MMKDKTGLGSCPMAGFDISGVKPSSFTNTQQIVILNTGEIQ
jgi:hypothetical protein